MLYHKRGPIQIFSCLVLRVKDANWVSIEDHRPENARGGGIPQPALSNKAANIAIRTCDITPTVLNTRHIPAD